MRKRIVIIGMGLVFGIGLVGCGPKKTTVTQEETVTTEEITTEEESDEIEGTIRVIVDDRELVSTKYAEYKKNFEKEYPDTVVELQSYEEYEKNAINELEGETVADVLFIPESVEREQYADYFEPLGTVEELSEFYDERVLNTCQIDGVIYGLPQYLMPQGIAYNRRVFEKAKIVELPKSGEDFLAMLEELQAYDESIIPFYINEKQEGNLSFWQPHVWGSVTGDATYQYNAFLNEKAPFGKGTPNYIVHELLYNIVAKGYAGEEVISKKMAEKMMNQGKIACMMVDWSQIATLQKADTNMDDIGYMPFPYEKDGVVYATTTMGSCYAVNKNSENKATARAWIEYMLQKSKYATSIGAISIVVEDELPKLLLPFQEVEFVIEEPATAEQKALYEKMKEQSGLDLDGDKAKKEVVALARKIASSDEEIEYDEEEPHSFEELMKSWNQRWKDN